jgi:hypothetical protein
VRGCSGRRRQTPPESRELASELVVKGSRVVLTETVLVECLAFAEAQGNTSMGSEWVGSHPYPLLHTRGADGSKNETMTCGDRRALSAERKCTAVMARRERGRGQGRRRIIMSGAHAGALLCSRRVHCRRIVALRNRLLWHPSHGVLVWVSDTLSLHGVIVAGLRAWSGDGE